MLDRFDIQIEVPLIQPWEFAAQKVGESSETVQKRVLGAIDFAKDRFKTYQIHNNAEADGKILDQIVALRPEAEKFLMDAAQKMMLSGRGYHRMLRLARTIADFEASASVEILHVTEALSFHRSARFRKD